MKERHTHARPVLTYKAGPEGAAACVIVLHEVWGLVPHIEDVCKRLGKLGFAAAAPDLYWEKKGLLNPESIQKAMEGVWDLSLEERRDRSKVREAMIKKGFSKDTLNVITALYDNRFRDRLVEDAASVAKQTLSKHRHVAVLGFCLGGGLALKVAAKTRGLGSVVSFYGEPPPDAQVRRISCPVLAIHAYHDEIINTKVPAFVDAAMKSGKDLTLKIYPKTRHGFFNDTRPTVYDESAAQDAWELATQFLKKTL